MKDVFRGSGRIVRRGRDRGPDRGQRGREDHPSADDLRAFRALRGHDADGREKGGRLAQALALRRGPPGPRLPALRAYRRGRAEARPGQARREDPGRDDRGVRPGRPAGPPSGLTLEGGEAEGPPGGGLLAGQKDPHVRRARQRPGRRHGGRVREAARKQGRCGSARDYRLARPRAGRGSRRQGREAGREVGGGGEAEGGGRRGHPAREGRSCLGESSVSASGTA